MMIFLTWVSRDLWSKFAGFPAWWQYYIIFMSCCPQSICCLLCHIRVLRCEVRWGRLMFLPGGHSGHFVCSFEGDHQKTKSPLSMSTANNCNEQTVLASILTNPSIHCSSLSTSYSMPCLQLILIYIWNSFLFHFSFFLFDFVKVNEMCPLRRFSNNPLISNWDQWCLGVLFVLNIFFQI